MVKNLSKVFRGMKPSEAEQQRFQQVRKDYVMEHYMSLFPGHPMEGELRRNAVLAYDRGELEALENRICWTPITKRMRRQRAKHVRVRQMVAENWASYQPEGMTFESIQKGKALYDEGRLRRIQQYLRID